MELYSKVDNEVVANLVKRGDFALEDRNFQEAAAFFEKALDADPECAEGYLGKFLAQSAHINLGEYTQQRLQLCADADYETQTIQKNAQHIEEMATKFAKPRLLSEKTIRGMYCKSFSFETCLPCRRAQRQQEEKLWKENPLLSRAEQFAKGAFAQKLTQDKKEFFEKLDQRIADAQTEEITAQQEQLAAYEEFIKQTDAQVQQAGKKDKRKLEALARKNLAKETPKKKNNPIALMIAALLLVIALVIGLVAFLPKKGEEQPADLESTPAEQTQSEDPETKYIQAEECLVAGDKRGALMIFRALGDYKDAPTRAEEIRLSMMQRNTISAGNAHTVGLKSDGTVVAVGRNGVDVSGWTDIVAISAGWDHTVGLKSDGTVVAIGRNDEGQCEVSGWTDIVAISAGWYHTVGLKSDGTVVAVGDNGYGQCDLSGWTDIVAISAACYHTVGLKSDGTVVAVGDNGYGRSDVAEWTDIVAISARNYHTVGLKSDGTVVAVGRNEYGRCDVSGWTDIVAISTGSNHTVGLKSDGTMVVVGRNNQGQCNVSGWTDIVAISAGGNNTVGLKSDGTVVTVGDNTHGQSDVSDWVLAVPEE